MSSVFGRVSGCQRPMPSLYINYYLCHCDQPVAFQCNTLPHCAAVVRLHISSRLGRFASEPLPARHALSQLHPAHLRFHPFKPPRLYPSLSLFSRARSLNLRPTNEHGRASFRVNSMVIRHGAGGRAKVPVSSRARQRMNGAGLSSGFQSRGGCCSRSSPLRYEAAFAAAEQRSRD